METETETRQSMTLVPPGSFEAFYRDWFPSVARAAGLVVRDVDEGQELAQEGFARLWSRWATIRSEDHARNFVFRVSLNQARSLLRRRRVLRRLGRGGDLGGAGTDSAASATDRVAVLRALGSLSVRQRQCVVVVDYLGYDAANAGRLLDMRPPTVRVHLMRGRAKLREQLGDES